MCNFAVRGAQQIAANWTPPDRRERPRCSIQRPVGGVVRAAAAVCCRHCWPEAAWQTMTSRRDGWQADANQQLRRFAMEFQRWW
jgi:hypothetical protein